MASRRRERNFARTQRMRDRWFSNDRHPYAILEEQVLAALPPDATLLDAGCGRTAPVLAGFRGRARRLIGIDAVQLTASPQDLELYCRDLSDTGLGENSVDIIYSRSVFEHLREPGRVLAEFRRILKPGGACFVLTPSLWDYASICSMLIPNAWHPAIVSRIEGRAGEDVFPAHYRCNTRHAVRQHARRAGLELAAFRYLGQYPAYFLFSPFLFAIAAQYEKWLRRHPALHRLLGWILFELRKPQ